jgi:hypothetical protein
LTEISYVTDEGNVAKEEYTHPEMNCPHPTFLRNHWTIAQVLNVNY